MIQLMDFSPDYAYVVDPADYTLLYINPVMRASAPSPDAVCCGQTCYKTLYNRSAPCPFCRMPYVRGEALEEDSFYSERHQRWIRIRIQNIDWEGRPAVAIVGTDISYQQITQEEEMKTFRRMNQMFQEMISSTSGSIQLNLTHNECLRIESSKPEFYEKLRNGSADEVFASAAEMIQDLKARERVRQQFNREALIRAFESGKRQLTVEYPWINTGRRLYWMQATAVLTRNPETGEIYAVIYVEDCTEESLSRQVMDYLSGTMFVYAGLLNTGNGELQYVSPVTDGKGMRHSYNEERLFRALALDEDERELYLRNSDFNNVVDALNVCGNCSVIFHRVMNGVRRRFQIKFEWLNKELHMAIMVCMDVTDAYLSEQQRMQELEAAKLQAEKASQAKTEFLSRISHDIRTPLYAIRSMTRFAREDRKNENKLLEDLETIESANEFLLSLIRDVLDISKIDSGRVEIHTEPVATERILADVERMFRSMAADKHLTFEASYEGEAMVLEIDRTRINQIMLNLVTNSIIYTHTGGVSVKVRTSAASAGGDSVRMEISVKDTGIGIHPEFIPHMFEPFAQDHLNPRRGAVSGGTGLGLYLVQKLVSAMRGSINVQSEQGKGTEITCSFLVKRSEAESTAPEKSPIVHGQEILSGTRVLVAEDNKVNAAILKRMLRELSVEADIVPDGLEAVKEFDSSERGRYTAILMDIQMPVMNGYESCRRIRSLPRPDALTIPIFALTADVFDEAKQEGFRAGMDGYLTKPVDPDLLGEVLRICRRSAETKKNG